MREYMKIANKIKNGDDISGSYRPSDIRKAVEYMNKNEIDQIENVLLIITPETLRKAEKLHRALQPSWKDMNEPFTI